MHEIKNENIEVTPKYGDLELETPVISPTKAALWMYIQTQQKKIPSIRRNRNKIVF